MRGLYFGAMECSDYFVPTVSVPNPVPPVLDSLITDFREAERKYQESIPLYLDDPPAIGAKEVTERYVAMMSAYTNLPKSLRDSSNITIKPNIAGEEAYLYSTSAFVK